ncbi:MAG: hypothetical protein NZ958_04220 [Bacteroidia bacterium]|nr:hypothetical protein [Bacteroidia bacterium]
MASVVWRVGIHLLSVGVCSGLVGSGCAPAPSEASSEAVDSAYVVPWEEVEGYMKVAPSPVQVAAWLRQERMGFYREPLHDPTLAGRYSGLQGAANLGIYLTDMAYAHATGNYQAAYEYLSAVQRLASRYGLEDIFSVERLKTLDRLQDKPDSIQHLFGQYYGEVQDRLVETGQQALLRHMILGGWLESLHIVLVLLGKENTDRKALSEVILLQPHLMPLLIRLYAIDTLHSPASRQILAHLDTLNQALRALPKALPTSPQTTVSGRTIRMVTTGGMELKPDQVKEVQKVLEKLRDFLT